MKNIILIDNRINKIALFEINLKIYLGATVSVFSNFKNVALNECHLIIAHANETDLPPNVDTPTILLTETLPQSSELYTLPSNCELKSLLKTSADILGVTAEEMAKTKVPDFFPIPTRLLKFLAYAPLDIFSKEDEGFVISINQGSSISTQSLEDQLVYVEASCRIRFVDAFSSQIQEMESKLDDSELDPVEKITCLDQTMNLLGPRILYSGIDEEIIELAQKSVNTLIQIAAKHDNAKELIKSVFNSDTSFRYKNAQLMVYISFHALKSLDWWIEDQRQDMSSAVFFHDILFQDDDLAKARDIEGIDSDMQNLVLQHPFETSELVKGIDEISEGCRTIILEHHGDSYGKSFKKTINDLAPLSKLFYLCEIYCTTILNHNSDSEFNEADFLEELNTKYDDKDSKQIIDALSQLKTDKLILALTDDLDSELTMIQGQFSESDIVQMLAPDAQEELTILKFAAENSGGFPDIEQKKIINATTEIIDQLEKTIVEDKTLPDTEKETRISGITERISDVATLVKSCIEKSKDAKTPLSDVRDNSGRTKLMVAALSGNLMLVDTVISEKSDIQLTDSTWPATI